MTVEVRLFSALREGRFRNKTLAVEPPASPADLLRQLAIPRQDVAITLVNGRFVTADAALAEGDVVALFPAIGGG